MTELQMTTDVEVEDFTDDLSDEALDRAEGALPCSSAPGAFCAPGPRGAVRVGS